MGVERFPSGKFDTNEPVLELTLIAYNILCMLGQETVRQSKAHVKSAVQRRRLRTVIRNIVHFAGHVTKHARQLILSVSRSNAWAAAFRDLQCALNTLEFHGFRCQKSLNILFEESFFQ